MHCKPSRVEINEATKRCRYRWFSVSIHVNNNRKWSLIPRGGRRAKNLTGFLWRRAVIIRIWRMYSFLYLNCKAAAPVEARTWGSVLRSELFGSTLQLSRLNLWAGAQEDAMCAPTQVPVSSDSWFILNPLCVSHTEGLRAWRHAAPGRMAHSSCALSAFQHCVLYVHTSRTGHTSNLYSQVFHL